jgi:hypothetical protein
MQQFILDLKYFPFLARIKLANKGVFFNPNSLLNNAEIANDGTFERGYRIERVSEDKSRLAAEIQLRGETLIRKLEFTYPNY